MNKNMVSTTRILSVLLSTAHQSCLLALSEKRHVPARHGDIPNAYLKADKEADVEILLHIPQGMVIDASTLERVGAMSKAQLALRLRKILYGLKQAGRLWAQHLRVTLLKLGFEQCFTDCCIYKRGSGMDLTIVGVYVDDLLVTGSSEENGSKFFDEMAVLNVKGLGVVLWFLGMGATYNEEDGYVLEQRQTIQELLDRFGLAEANSVRVPISDDQDEDAESSLLWIARCTRPDIAFAVHRVTRRAHAPVEADWRRTKRIARYLKGTIGFKLYLTGDSASNRNTPVRIEGYSDAD
ncbi:hypothetical protein PC111_g7463 [Phytophthora cactorum]|uniref:Reverse transcriptase Ty1/copia-type domain-containing protein n=1 Tax=Phytophthora cactorum TaxID=29920 RepID=A0A8T1E7L2_9STRA|nr:hypothetical protein PC111_g7463 [Phytophthora cactorum]KAG2832608.1 hypothetical protein PC112_g6824 [Phytophthora cactorum]KAG2932317.1 hypothetical protein PC115_g5825 [Phytophthora cactorum]KAG2949127.1 hypothetical protein PC117_g5463 [Phytophthora cactorum]KAG3180050.1 hypothetical protein C6341_g7120 [Phytophthora cactorum]